MFSIFSCDWLLSLTVLFWGSVHRIFRIVDYSWWSISSSSLSVLSYRPTRVYLFCSHSVAATKHSDQRQLTEEGLTCLALPFSVHHSGHLGQELKEELEVRHCEDCSLLPLSLAYAQPSFLIHPRPTCLGMVLLREGWPLLHQLFIKIISHTSTDLLDESNSSTKAIFPFLDNSNSS